MRWIGSIALVLAVLSQGWVEGATSKQITGTSRVVPGFHEGICTVAVLLEECDGGGYCSTAEGSLAGALASIPEKPFRFLHPRVVEARMAQAGFLDYDDASRAEIGKAVEADAFLLLRVPHADKEIQTNALGRTIGGAIGSEFTFRVEVRMVRLSDGQTVLIGTGGGTGDGDFSGLDRWLGQVFKRIFHNPRISKAFQEAAQSSACDSPSLPAANPAADAVTTPTEEVPANEPEYVSELRALAELRDQGVITAEDFEAKKRQLLGLEDDTGRKPEPP